MKFNWGHGIALFILAFVGFIVLMVVKAFQTSTDLTAENYYSQELAYGSRIEAITNANSLEQHMVISLKENHLEIDLPASLTDGTLEGEIHFYRPDNAAFDFVQPINATEKTQEVSYSKLISGNYSVRVKATQEGKEFFFEEALNFTAK